MTAVTNLALYIYQSRDLCAAPYRAHAPGQTTVAEYTQRDSVVNQRTHPGKFPPLGRRASGIEVHEEKWGTVTVQHVYKMRCECGRSWFELELPRFVKCPACHKLDYVST